MKSQGPGEAENASEFRFTSAYVDSECVVGILNLHPIHTLSFDIVMQAKLEDFLLPFSLIICCLVVVLRRLQSCFLGYFCYLASYIVYVL